MKEINIFSGSLKMQENNWLLILGIIKNMKIHKILILYFIKMRNATIPDYILF